jgi:TonB family protein
LSFRRSKRAFAAGLLLIGLWARMNSPVAWGQELNRRTKNRIVPNYPELAQRMKLTGVVRVMITVAPNGTIKDAKLVGGHPLLGTAALDAIRKWRFEAGSEESTGVVEFRFDPNQ